MTADPRMSPIFHDPENPDWDRLSPSNQAALLAAFTPQTALQRGKSYQVAPDGTLIPLQPGKPVPADLPVTP